MGKIQCTEVRRPLRHNLLCKYVRVYKCDTETAISRSVGIERVKAIKITI